MRCFGRMTPQSGANASTCSTPQLRQRIVGDLRGCGHFPRQTWITSIAAMLSVSVSFHGCDSVAVDQPALAQQSAEAPQTPEPPSSTSTSKANQNRSGNDWPVFLGPSGNGISQETNLITSWPADGPPVLWSKEIGTGYSAPSVQGDQLVVFHRQGDSEVIECLSAANGNPIWRSEYRSAFRDPYGYNNGPRCSPLLDGDRCFTFGAEGVLRCSNMKTGTQIWQRKTQEEFTVPQGFFGVGATPILVDGILIVPVGGQPNSCLVGMNPDNGETLWESVGQKTWEGVETGFRRNPTYEWTGEEMVISYSSPMAATIHGQTHVLCLTRQGLVSVDPKTGEENFHYWFRSATHESVNAARPVVVDDTVLISSTYEVGAACLKIAPGGKSFDVLWKTQDTLETHWSTATYYQGYYYGFTRRHERDATMVCIDAKTGDLAWESDGWGKPVEGLRQNREGQAMDEEGNVIPWPFYGRGSATLADGCFYVLGERGTFACVEANPKEWNETARCAAPGMSYPSWAAPVISRGRMFLRDEDTLICLDLAKPAE